MKKGKHSCLVLCMLVSLLLSSNAYGADVTKEESLAGQRNQQETYQVEPRVEQVRWYYRVYKGVPQKRLWSITYGRWKTDWISR